MTGRHAVLRYGVATFAGLFLVCAVVAGVASHTLTTTRADVEAATSRSFGTVLRGSDGAVSVRWDAPGGPRTDSFDIAGSRPRDGTRVEVAYDPDDPATAFVPVSAELEEVDRAWSAVAFAATATGLALLTAGWQVVSRARIRRQPTRSVAVRRVRFSTGLSARSWLETETYPHRWIPVHFDPVLVTLPTPSVVSLQGDPRSDRLVGAVLDEVLLYPSGGVRVTEPPGRRLDNPAAPDDDARCRAARIRPRDRLRTDGLLATPAPLVGLLWAFVDGGGVGSWLAVTAISAAGALCWGAVRGTDPT